MDVAALMPSGITDEWREQARTWTVRWYRKHFPGMPIYTGTAAGEWSKGAAIADALAQSSAELLVLADADSHIFRPDALARAIEHVAAGRSSWATPHGKVYRLSEVETRRLHNHPDNMPRLGWTCRPIYEGIAGGGITVVTRAAFELVGGVDPRFLGWGGEDVAFGYALETLTGRPERFSGELVHLWHPHPAPTLRGSPASEELVAQYKHARGVARRMRAVLAGEPVIAAEPLPRPVRFRMTANRNALKLPCGDIVRFAAGIYETSDPDEVEQIRRFPIVSEEHPR